MSDIGPVFILAGGLGTGLSEETTLKPKVEVGDTPLLVHAMRGYYAQGCDDFVICAGDRTWEQSDFLSSQLRQNHLSIHLKEELAIDGTTVTNFSEKPDATQILIIVEREPVSKLAAVGQPQAYERKGFWHPVETLRDSHDLRSLWQTNARWIRTQ